MMDLSGSHVNTFWGPYHVGAMKHDQLQFKLRLSAELKAKLDEFAAKNDRTLTAEIVDRLQQSLNDKGNVNLPEGIIEMLQEAAEKTGRSVDGELYARIIDTFGERPDEARLREMLEDSRRDAARLREQVVQMEAAQSRSGDTLYILMDAHGYPISWGEIAAYIDELKLRGKSLPSNWDATIVTPDMESSSRRTAEAAKLAKKLRAEGKSQVVPGKLPTPRKILKREPTKR